MQLEVSVEVEEHVERLVRCTHVVREDGIRQQVSRELIRTVSTIPAETNSNDFGVFGIN